LAGLACATKAAGVLAGAGLLAFALKRRAAATRHLVWSLGLAGAMALLPLAVALPRWGLPILSAGTKVSEGRSSAGPEARPGDRPTVEAVASTARIEPRSRERGTLTAEEPAARIAPVAVTTPRWMGSATWPLAVWGAGTAAVVAWCAVGWVTIWRLGRTAEHITDWRWVEAAREAAERLGVARGVTLLRGTPAAMPMTWGVLRPVVLLPAEADEWPAERRRAVLMHELAHVRRRDCLTQWLGVTACAAYWFNPLTWRAAARLRSEREQACDDLVLEAGERPSDYAAQLLGVAR
jgi:beta-lactamase regulating signal transducer with metallopeptidase domain